MLYKLSISAALFVLVAYALAEALGPPRSMGPLVAYAVAFFVCGYHRNVLPDGQSLSWTRVPVPTKPAIRIQTTLWGVAIEKPKRGTAGARVMSFMVASPGLARIRELLPLPLKWVVSQAVTLRQWRP